ncbi:CBF-domain-containing protein [Fomitiporia mediterranea MF3/22]|uniref:CBF-domain-containing protein n=1 Tax=Fomitiporia mediterranea (strain MF3/22) TaxID=694068 RepID=UPI0004407CBD|nr:CBF-domain-containing protein [Fomitiporia mediterranea MF3/22]EJC98214.1 CBF-domain-containing protein [Fomitiporia mediterranea MF3/22]
MVVSSLNSNTQARKRKSSANGSRHDGSTAKSIKDLEDAVSAALTSNASLNPLSDLLKTAASPEDSDVALKAMFALYRLFILISQKGILSAQDDEDAGRKTVRAWIIARLDSFTDLLCGLLQYEEKTLRLSALRILFSLLRQMSSIIPTDSSSTSSTTTLRFDVPFFQKIVRALLLCPSSAREPMPKRTRRSQSSVEAGNEIHADVRDLLLETWLNVYADIRWFFLRETAYVVILENEGLVASHPYLPANALTILEKLTGIPSSSDTSFKFTKNHFWVEALNTKPKLSKKGKTGPLSDSESESDVEGEKQNVDDWRAFFEEPKQETGKKSYASGGRRLYTLPIHAQLHAPAAHRAVFTRAWLALLPLLSRGGEVFLSSAKAGDDQEDLALVARVLVVLHRGVLPYLTRPVLIMDWVGSCVDHGGYVGLLALNALFVLMREYNLDYPSFYTRLYVFLDRNVLHTRHRARFFRLTELFLSSSHLPATLLASFVKRLARLSLSAPPAGVIIAIPFIYNILKRHPVLMCMIHRPIDSTEEKGEDSFNENEPNPTLTNALGSSLWEVAAHRQHYHAPAATLAHIFEEAFTRPGFSMEDFLDHTYTTLFETEVNRKIKKEPAVLEYELEHSRPMIIRLSEEQEPGSLTQPDADVASTLWVFG